MPSTTTFLSLTLPEFQEFINSWHEPVNQNMEDIDAFLEDLHNSLVTSSATSTWSALRGSLGSLADRLDVSILPDGTIDLSSSPEILGLATSSTKGTEASPDDDPRGRFDRSDFEIYDARQAFPGDRFTPIGASGPSAGFPEEDIDSGLAIRSADFGADSTRPVSSPQRPWSPGIMVGGGGTFISAPGGIGILRLDGSSAPAVINIDGYLFRIREQIDFDYGTGLSPTNGNHVWIYVERVEANYGDANFLYDQTAGFATKDLRILQSGTAGVTVASSGLFTDTTTPAAFNTSKIGKAKAGDILVIDDTSAAGKYVIDTIDPSDTSCTIRGEFKADVSGATWHIQDNHHPNIGAVETDADPETLPAFVAGRVYIGRCVHDTGGDPTDIVNFAKGGVFDSDWQPVTAAGLAGTPLVLGHNLGVSPTHVQIFLRSAPNAETYPPIVERQFVTDFDEGNTTVDSGDAKKHTMLVPSMRWHSDTKDITIRLLNAQSGNLSPVASALFTDGAGSDVTAGDIRVICRR